MRKGVFVSILVILCVISVFGFSACNDNSNKNSNISHQNSVSVEDKSFDFLSYSSDKLYDIYEITTDDYAKDCITYKFMYKPEENVDVVGFISIPVECLTSQTPHKCVIWNRGGNSNIGAIDGTITEQISAYSNRIAIASQYRGSEGCTGRDEFGGADLNDVTALIDFCENFKFVDMTDLCVAGVSRGGMMSYMTARNDDRVKKIISVSGASDLIQGYEDREDMKKVLNNFIGGSPQSMPEEYENRSAIYWADEINVPVLIIHSKKDEQVSFSQAEAMANALVENGTVCYFKTYNDKTHGLHKKDIDLMVKFLNDEDLSKYLHANN